MALMLPACSTDAAGSATTDSGVRLDAMNPITTGAPAEPYKPASGKHIMILVCGNFGLGCVRIAEGAKEAAESLGWQADLVDGRLDPTVQNRAVKQAVDSGVDGIISVAGDPNLMGEAMAAVQAKDVPFAVVSQTPKQGDLPGVDSWIRPDAAKGGSESAQWVAEDSAGKGSVLVLDLPDFADVMMRNNALADRLKSDCPGCTVYRANVSSQTMGSSLAPLVTSQLQQHPDLTYVWSPDDALSNFVAQGIQQADKTSGVKLVSTAGAPDALARIQTGTQAADLASPDNYMGWLAFDSLARVVSGKPGPQVVDVPQRFFSPVNISEGPSDMTKTGWTVEFDYRSQFKKTWGMQ